MAYQEHVRDSQQISARCAVITLSDTRTVETDESGRKICDLLAAGGHAIVNRRIILDEPDGLHALLTELLAAHDLDVVLMNGGTGISRRDTTIEVVQTHLDQVLPGFGEL